MPPPPEISVVVPVFNEADNLTTLVDELDGTLANRGGGYEILLVDDGSTDGSLEVIRALAAARPRLRVLRMPGNRGQSAALLAGFRAVRAPVTVTLDADLQNDPADIPRLLEALDGCDVVSGIRAVRRDSWVRRVASRISNRVRNWVVHDGVTDVGCSLKAYRSDLLRELPAFNSLHRFLPALVKMRGARIRELPVHHRPRIHGESKYTIGNRLWRGIVDLAGVRWLQSRWVEPRQAVEEAPEGAPEP
jgi:glycosyltransferase involved in cell wall biosynthesis